MAKPKLRLDPMCDVRVYCQKSLLYRTDDSDFGSKTADGYYYYTHRLRATRNLDLPSISATTNQDIHAICTYHFIAHYSSPDHFEKG
jgi:hypothetical protein